MPSHVEAVAALVHRRYARFVHMPTGLAAEGRMANHILLGAARAFSSSQANSPPQTASSAQASPASRAPSSAQSLSMSATPSFRMRFGMLILANLMGSAVATQGLVNGNRNFEFEDGAKPGGCLWVSILLACILELDARPRWGLAGASGDAEGLAGQRHPDRRCAVRTIVRQRPAVCSCRWGLLPHSQ